MLKLIGALLIVFAAAAFGFTKASRYAARPRQIRQLILSLQRLETEIVYGFTPLPDALRAIGKQTAAPLSAIYTRTAESLANRQGSTTRDCWQFVIKQLWPSTAMSRNEQEILLQIGFSLGITDREDQIKHLRLAVSQLQAEELQAWEEQRRYEKMWRALGVLSGLLVVIIMY